MGLTKIGAWVRIDDVYGLWCSECGKAKLVEEGWIITIDEAEGAKVSGVCPTQPRIHCLACDAINKTTNSKTLAAMIYEWRHR